MCEGPALSDENAHSKNRLGPWGKATAIKSRSLARQTSSLEKRFPDRVGLSIVNVVTPPAGERLGGRRSGLKSSLGKNRPTRTAKE